MHEIRAVIRAIVLKIFGLDNPIVVSYRRWDCFVNVIQHLLLCTGKGIVFNKKLAAINTDHYYNLLEETMKVNNLLNAPDLIFNADETDMSLCYHSGANGRQRFKACLCVQCRIKK